MSIPQTILEPHSASPGRSRKQRRVQVDSPAPRRRRRGWADRGWDVSRSRDSGTGILSTTARWPVRTNNLGANYSFPSYYSLKSACYKVLGHPQLLTHESRLRLIFQLLLHQSPRRRICPSTFPNSMADANTPSSKRGYIAGTGPRRVRESIRPGAYFEL